MPRAQITRTAAEAGPSTGLRGLLPLIAALLLLAPGMALADATVERAYSGALLALNDAPPVTPLDDGDDDAAGWDDDDWLEDEFDLESEFGATDDHDPLEPMNRGVFAFNRQVDRFMLTPVTGVYQGLVPTVGRQGIHNVFMNLDAPVRMTNAMLQGRPKASGIALARFIVNATFGLGGLFDVGSHVGLPEQRADFGQTLATWGTPQGAYLVFPFLGPMTLRHGFGMGVDFVMQPVSYVVGPLPGMIVGAGKDFSRREQSAIELESLKDASLDFYAALRSAFLQDRADLIARGATDSGIVDVASTLSDSAEALTPQEREARCLATARSRREMWKPGLRGQLRRRCAEAGLAP